MADIPEHLLRRSAEAKAKATGRSVEEVLAEMKGETPAAAPQQPAAPETAPEAPAPAASGGPVDLAAAAAALGMPEHLLRRSAEAKAKATGLSVDDIVAEMAASAELSGKAAAPRAAAPPPAAAGPTPAPAPAPEAAAPAAGGPIDWAALAASQGMPEKLLRRSVEAKAKATGVPVEAIVAEMTGQPVPAEPAPTSAEPAPAPAAAPAPEAAAPAAGGPIDWAALAASQGMPEKLLRRSVEAKAKKSGQSIEAIVAEMTGQPVPAAAPTPAAAPAPAAAVSAAAAAPAPARAVATAPQPIPEGVRTQRLLTVVKAKAIQQVRREPADKVNVWPHLLAIEFVALLVVLAGLIVFSIFQDAPLLELANPNEQPNPSKAPWYFLGLQELLSYFDPQIAGVLIPGLGLAGLAIIPYIDRNPSVRPSNRKFIIMVFTFFVMAAAITTIIGSFYRGPGFNFTFPWRDGIFFDL